MTQPQAPYTTEHPKIDTLMELLESFTLEQLQFIAKHAKDNDWGYILIGLKRNPDTILFIPSLKLPREIK